MTAPGAPAPELHIQSEIVDQRFVIASGESDLRVSWQVTGIRRDPWAKAYPTEPETEKPEPERGFYRHPKVYDLLPEHSIDWVKHSELLNLTEAVRKAEGPRRTKAD